MNESALFYFHVTIKVQEDQLADLKDKLCLVEKLRDQNSEKEAEIAQVLRQQQYQRWVPRAPVHTN